MDDQLLAELRAGFISEAQELLDKAEGYFLVLEKNPGDTQTLQHIFNVAHNIKGSGKAVGFDALSKFAHQVENLLVAIRNGQVGVDAGKVSLLLACCDAMRIDLQELAKDPNAVLEHAVLESLLADSLLESPPSGASQPPETPLAEPHAEDEFLPVPPEASPEPVTLKLPKLESAPKSQKKSAQKEEFVRIPVQKIDALLNNLGEQVILQSMLDQSKFDLVGNADLVTRTITQLNKLTYEMQQTAITLRMVNLKTLFSKLERAGRDAARLLDKQIEFIFRGAEQELDKSIVEVLADPLTHMIRNSVDHGIESPEERAAAGKPERGTVIIEAHRRGGTVHIDVVDDGKGLDPERIYQKGVSQGLIKPGSKHSEEEIFALIFENGFSTRDTASELSGRGVGMNVVKEAILALRGTYKIESAKGKGTRFSIRLPLTLAIFNGLVVQVGERRYIVPSADVQELTSAKNHRIRKTSAGSAVVCIRDEVFPLVDLASELHRTRSDSNTDADAPEGTLLLTRNGTQRCALRVDEVLAQQKVVHKTFEHTAAPMRGVGGATILGDGSVALILELGTFVPDARSTQS